MDVSQITDLALIAFLLVISAFFSGSETALTAASRARMHHLEQSGSKRAKRANALAAKPERLIGSILLGNNLANIMASSLATSVLISLVGDAAVAVATLVMTLLILIFAEVLPKTYAIRNPERVSLAVAPLIAMMVPVLAPAVYGVQWVVTGTLKMLGLYEPGQVGKVSAEDELRGAIDLHARAGSVGRTSTDMLGSILELDEVDLSEVMIHRGRVFMLNIDDPPEQIVAAAFRANFTRIPLWRGEREEIAGVLHIKDLARALSRNGGDAGRLDIKVIAREAWFVPETTTLREQFNAFRRRKAHMALVIDEYGDLQGVVTLEDILEEIVGEISDEHDAVTQEVVSLPDGAHEVEGSATIRDLNRQFDWNLPDEDAATVAGLVVHEAQTLPRAGQVFRFHGFTFEVLERRGNRVSRLKITPPDQPADES